MKYPLISVIIPNYCHARYLKQRIDSILKQTYQNFEIIILDDCSTDNSKEVIESYRDNKHVTHIVYNTENGGNTFKQWEKGISLSQGELCYIAESDDYNRPMLLEKLVRQFESDPNLVLAECRTFWVNEQGLIYEGINPIGKSEIYSGKEYLRKYMSGGNHIYNAGMALFSRKVALQIDDCYKSYLGAGDYKFWVEIAEQGNVAVVDEPLNFFRRHEGVVTGKRDSDGSNSIANKKIFDYLCQMGYLDEKNKRFGVFANLRLLRSKQFDNDGIRKKLEQIWYMSDEDFQKEESRKESLLIRIKNKFSHLLFKFKVEWFTRVKHYSYDTMARKLYRLE